MEHPRCRRLVSVPLEGDKHTGKLGVGGVSPHSGGGGVFWEWWAVTALLHTGRREGGLHEKQPSCLQAVSQRGSLGLVENRKELKC